jgi:CPA2 family monovalent cation:H+ antiporter-2
VLPLGVAFARSARHLGVTLASVVLPDPALARADLAAAPRRALVVSVEIAAVLLAGLPVLAVTQPFLRGVPGAVLLVIVLAVLGLAFWRGATNLDGHVRAGAAVLAEALARSQQANAKTEEDPLERAKAALPGLGDPVVVRLDGGSRAIGQTLAAVDLRGLTGATVLAIWRADGAVMVPSAKEVLKEGDVLALAGSREAVTAAREVLDAQETANESMSPARAS